jgi:hypothetical protein
MNWQSLFGLSTESVGIIYGTIMLSDSFKNVKLGVIDKSDER